MGATDKTLIGHGFTNFNVYWKAETSYVSIWKSMFGFPPLFVTQNGTEKPYNAHFSNFTQKGGNICGFQEHVRARLNFECVSGINLDAFRRVDQVENSKTNSPLLNFTRINSIGRLGSF